MRIKDKLFLELLEAAVLLQRGIHELIKSQNMGTKEKPLDGSFVPIILSAARLDAIIEQCRKESNNEKITISKKIKNWFETKPNQSDFFGVHIREFYQSLKKKKNLTPP